MSILTFVLIYIAITLVLYIWLKEYFVIFWPITFLPFLIFLLIETTNNYSKQRTIIIFILLSLGILASLANDMNLNFYIEKENTSKKIETIKLVQKDK